MGEKQYGRRTKNELLADGLGQRQHGDGALFQTVVHGKNVWRAAKIIDLPDGSKKKVQGTGQTAAAARENLQRNIDKRLSGEKKKPLTVSSTASGELSSNSSFNDVAQDWLAIRKTQGGMSPGKTKLRPQTLNSYRLILQNHLERWGSRPIKDYTKDDVKRFFYRELPERHEIGNSHLRAIQGVIRQVFEHACDWNLISTSPADKVKLAARDKVQRLSKVKTEGLERLTWIPDRIMSYLEPGKKPGDFLDEYQFPDEERWKAYERHSLNEARWGLSCILGLRPAEVAGLTWERITYLGEDGSDPKRRPQLVIEQQLARDPSRHGDTKLYISPNPKSESGVRALPLSPELVQMLRRWKKIQTEWRKDTSKWDPYPHMKSLVFTTRTGKPRKQQTDSNEWRDLLAQVFRGDDEQSEHIRNLRQYSLRHICLTRLLKAGAPLVVVSNIAGHSSVSITASVYGHLDLEDKVEWLSQLSTKTMRERSPEKKNETAQ